MIDNIWDYLTKEHLSYLELVLAIIVSFISREILKDYWYGFTHRH
jgi:uncharacterized protein (DUF2164 family)